MDAAQTSWQPSRLSEFIGQQSLIQQLDVEIRASIAQMRPVKHGLFTGPPGTGKNTLARLIARERGSPPPVELMGSSLTHEQLSMVLLNLPTEGYGQYGDLVDPKKAVFPILVLDEAEAVATGLMELFHGLLEPRPDGLRIFMARFGRVVAPRWAPQHTWIFLTNFKGELIDKAPAAVSRIAIQHHLSWYEDEEIERMILLNANVRKIDVDDDAIKLIAKRCNGSARMAVSPEIGLLTRAADFAAASNEPRITRAVAQRLFDMLGIDQYGLDELLRSYLDALITAGGRLGLHALASMLDTDPKTLTYVEPTLVKRGFIVRTSSGREITPAGHNAVQGVRDPANWFHNNRLTSTDTK